MRIAVVINAAAGGLIGKAEAAATVAETLCAAGLDPVVVPPEGTLGERLDAALALGAAAVVVGGGDGTITAAAQRLVGTGVPLGILPLGTMNVLARDLGLPLGLEAAAAALAHGHARAMDAAEVNGHVFLNASVIGLPSHLGRHRERERGRLDLRGKLRFATAALRGVVHHPPMRLQITIGEEHARVWTRALAVTNNRLDEDAARFPARQALDRGELGLYVAQDFGAWWVTRFVLRVLLRRWRYHPELTFATAPEIVIHSPRHRLRVMNDGEALLLETPLRYRILPGALRVLVPPDAPAETAPAPPLGETAPERTGEALPDLGAGGR
ncbi:diacylglycerol/lipid kinase family protein [Crenalkalicoccus roseus]|uniref:diacylglycerol/lipid kinase family protein n=1 Tax=Crenalkalicoccus roseus TaxID=1485588 RepID=UPI0010806FB3|nr:diacylglycerol kinase family protein [Crenalkalicoccus roseus]